MPDYSNGSAFVDEEFVPISEAKISLLDWGFLRSDTETIGRPKMLIIKQPNSNL